MPKPDDSHHSDVSLQHVALQHVDNQDKALRFSIGRGVSETIIDAEKEILANAPRHPNFIKFEGVAFLYEKIGGEKTNSTVNVVDKHRRAIHHQRGTRFLGSLAITTVCEAQPLVTDTFPI